MKCKQCNDEGFVDFCDCTNIGADIAVQKLREIAEHGKHVGVFGGSEIEAAAQAILALRGKFSNEPTIQHAIAGVVVGADALKNIATTGVHKEKFGNSHLEEAAQAILSLHTRIKLADDLIMQLNKDNDRHLADLLVADKRINDLGPSIR